MEIELHSVIFRIAFQLKFLGSFSYLSICVQLPLREQELYIHVGRQDTPKIVICMLKVNICIYIYPWQFCCMDASPLTSNELLPITLVSLSSELDPKNCGKVLHFTMNDLNGWLGPFLLPLKSVAKSLLICRRTGLTLFQSGKVMLSTYSAFIWYRQWMLNKIEGLSSD